MNEAATIAMRQKYSNLHLYIDGMYTTETAMRSAAMISRYHTGKGNVFIHTKKISKHSPQAKDLFGDLVQLLKLPKRSIYFIGKTGFDLCHNGGRIILVDKNKLTKRKKKRCPGRRNNDDEEKPEQ